MSVWLLGVPISCWVTPPLWPFIRFLFVSSEFRFRLPLHLASRRRSCLPLSVPANRPEEDFHLQVHRRAWHTSFGRIRADDAAPWLTIILVGHVFLPFAFLVDVDWMPLWAAMGTWAGCFTAIALAILPRAKALFIAVLWHTRAPGYEGAPTEFV